MTSTRRLPVTTAAEALLATLKARGIDYLLANPGTDFAPIIEGLARAPSAGLPVPTPVAVTHEAAAIAMAHGYWLASGRPLALMVHVNVGLANTLMGVINAARDNVPLLLLSGRTPIGEGRDRLGARDLPIHWGQEMRDQGGMLRELVKWDYELRQPEQVPDLVDRALAIATSPPMGPVYLALPREVLCEPLDGLELREAAAPAGGGTDRPRRRASLDEAARLIAAAERPLVITSRAGAFADGFAALTALAERFALPVVEFWPSRISLPASHPMHAGFDPGPALAEADLVLVVDALVPWVPRRHELRAGCRVVQLGPDPLFAATPVRGFPCDLALAGEVATSLRLLAEALEDRLPARVAAERRERLAARHAKARAERLAAADGGRRPADDARLRQPDLARGPAGGRDPVLRAGLRPGGDGLRGSPAAISASRPRAAWAGACRRRSAPSSPIRTAPWSPPSATAATCSPTRPPATRWPRRWTCRS